MVEDGIERRPRIPLLLNPLVWFLATLAALAAIFAAFDVLGPSTTEGDSLSFALFGALFLGGLAGSPILYGVLLRRAGADWFDVTGRLVLVLVGYVLAGGVIVPDLLGAIDRGKQKRTMADMRAMATGIEAYLATHPEGGRASSVAEVNAILGLRFSRWDGWGDEFFVRWDGRHYLLRSFGMDGRQTTGRSPEEYVVGETNTFADDIVLVDGAFVRYPEGPQPSLTPPTPRP